jgi:hypothetical protein
MLWLSIHKRSCERSALFDVQGVCLMHYCHTSALHCVGTASHTLHHAALDSRNSTLLPTYAELLLWQSAHHSPSLWLMLHMPFKEF